MICPAILDYDFNSLQFAGSIENTSEWKYHRCNYCVDKCLGGNLLLIELCLSEARGYVGQLEINFEYLHRKDILMVS